MRFPHLLLLPLLFCLACTRESAPPSERPAITAVSLAPSITELVCAMGAADQLVGRTSYCNFPPDLVTNIPVVGGFGLPSIEALISLRPTYVLEVDLEDESLARRLTELGIDRRRITCRTLNDIPPAIEEIGQLLDHRAAAHTLATNLAQRIQAIRDTAPLTTNRPRVFLQIWNDPVMTATPSSFISELLTLAGGENICSNAPADFIQVSSEWVVGSNPDIILCLEGDGTAPAREQAMKRPGWHTIQAVKKGRVYDHFNMDILTRPGPRVLEGIDLLRNTLAEPPVVP